MTVVSSEPSVNLVEAVNMALAYEMEHDESVVVLGEDVGVNGGVFRATANLRERFGFERVMDTPLAEGLIAGLSVGMATQGLKPVAEIQFMGFVYAAMEHIICHAARMRNRTRGRLTCPMVLRAPYGGGIGAPELHSESTEALFAHIPGLRVVVPSSPMRAYGLLLGAVRNPDPVIFLEPKRIYRAVRHDVADDGRELPLDICFTLRVGGDVTLVTWGAMVADTLSAARELSSQGIEAEVIDVATLKPLDMDTILTSVRKTGRCVVIHEAARSGGVGAEIVAGVAEHGLMDLLMPPARITGYDVTMPYFRNEHSYLPNAHDIVHRVRELMEQA